MKPILFNTDMVRAILAGRKTVMRRVIKGYIPEGAKWGYTAFTPKGCISCRGVFSDGYGDKFYRLPYRPGDILYVRETWFYEDFYEGAPYEPEPDLPSGRRSWRYVYKAENPDYPIIQDHWRPSIHMPREAARIFLRVTEVRVERLQDITRDDTSKEGRPCWMRLYGGMCGNGGPCDGDSYAREFSEFWDTTIKPADRDKYGWAANPWVFVISFERITQDEAMQ